MFGGTSQHCMIHHTVHNKVNHSAAASQERTPAKLHMLARAMGVTCVEDLSDRDHTVWEVKGPATAKLPRWLALLYAPRNC